MIKPRQSRVAPGRISFSRNSPVARLPHAADVHQHLIEAAIRDLRLGVVDHVDLVWLIPAPQVDIVDKLNREITAVMKDPDTGKRFAEQGAEVVVGSPEDFGRLVQSEIVKWGKLIQSAKITAD